MIYFLSQQYATKNIFSDSKPPLVLQISSLTGNLQEHFSDNSLQWLLVEFGLIGFMASWAPSLAFPSSGSSLI
jgi:hypothetical protein